MTDPHALPALPAQARRRHRAVPAIKLLSKRKDADFRDLPRTELILLPKPDKLVYSLLPDPSRFFVETFAEVIVEIE